MENNKYHEAVERVTTPPELKEKTRRMLTIEIRKQKFIWKPGTYMALAAALILIVGAGFLVFNGPGGSLLGGGILGRDGQGSSAPAFSAPSSFEPGDTAPGISAPGSTVQGDIELNFVLIDASSPPFRMGHQYPLRRELSLAELPGVIPENAPSGFRLIDEIITAYFSEPTDTPDAIIGELTYQTQNGDLLTVVFTDITIYMPIEIGSSHIHDVPVGVGHTEEDEKFYGAFEMYGFTYLLTAEGISRREFTQALIHFITSL